MPETGKPRRRTPSVVSAAAILLLLVLRIPAQSASVAAGRALFLRTWLPAEGLGPEFNGSSCVACHADPSAPIAGNPMSAVPTVFLSPAVTDPTGGHLFRRFIARPGGRILGTQPPARAVRHRAPSLAGIGLLEVVPLAGAGAPIGRYGWKARYPTLELAIAGALAGEWA